VIRPISDHALHQTPEDWRILRALSLYRLLLVTLQLVLYETGYLERIFDEFKPSLFYVACVAHAVLALLLMLPMVYRRPGAGLQAHAQFAVDTAAILLMAYAAGGVPSGLGMLLLASAVGCSMVLTLRPAMVQAAGATLATFAEEVYRLYPEYDSGPFTQTGILGLMFFATSLASNVVAARARKSEAFAAQVGSDLASLARLNESVIEHMQTGVVVINADGRIRLLNAAAAALLQAGRDQKLADVAPGLAQALTEWRRGQRLEGAPVVARPGGEELVPRFSRLAWAEPAPVLVLLDPARLVREQALQMNLAALGRLSASIAHEIRNPLSAISQAGQLLSESTDLRAEDRHLLSMIQRHSDRIDRIVRDVLALSRREAPLPGVILLRPWLERAVAQYREAHPDRAIRIDRVAPDFVMRFDAAHLQQVLFNLWDNSFVHGGKDGRRICVELATPAAREDSPPWLEIRDDGPGIPEELRERAFEPFFSTAHGGTGLGLYLARELCEYNRARLTYRAMPTGACFHIVLAQAAREAA
jgi:two-component system, NtrC family, sensor histidine kinase PilS